MVAALGACSSFCARCWWCSGGMRGADIGRRAAVLYYDYVLTFADEVRYFWNTSRMSTFAMLFLVSRYISLVSHVPIAVMALGTPDPLVRRHPPLSSRPPRTCITLKCGPLPLLQMYAGLLSARRGIVNADARNDRCNRLRQYHQILTGLIMIIVSSAYRDASNIDPAC